MMTCLRMTAVLLATTSMGAIVQPAHGQETDAASLAENAAAGEVQADTTQDIVVTGSRIVRNGDEMPTPVTVFSKDTLQDVRPTSLSEGLQVLPVFAGSRGQNSNPSAAGGVGGGNGVAAQVNLRNLGAERTLVLLDGRRVPPSSFTNFVDIDMIPSQLIDRVEVVTGGVSAVYGSEAVSGVVNFILNKNFNGLKAHAQMGISQRGDSEQFNAGAAFGTAFADGRGHFELSYEYRDDKGITHRSDRDWFRQSGVVGAGTAAAPYQLLENLRLAQYPFGGRITCGTACSINGQYFASDGVLAPFVDGTATSTNNVQVGGSGGYNDMSLRSPLESHQVFGRLDFEISNGLAVFAEVGGNIKNNQYYAGGFQLSNVVISSTNAFLPAEYQAALAAAGQTTFRFSRLDNNYRETGDIDTNNWMFVGGLTGKVGAFNWELSYTRGISRLHTNISNVFSNQLVAAALDAVYDSNGNIVCQASLANSAYANCVPINVFGPSSVTPAAAAYALGAVDYRANNDLDDVLATITGSPFSTWAGEVGVALSAEWRKVSFSAESTAEPTDPANCANIRYNCSGSYLSTTFPSHEEVSDTVKEIAAEVEVPLLRDSPLARSFVVSGAARYTDYQSVGSYWTWKGGFDWRVFDSLRFRGTISRDIRAPTLNDLYAAQSVVPGTFQDLLTNTSNFVPSINDGNPNLTPEIGHTWTVGGVVTPTFLPGFSLAIDYYHIKISNAITTVQGFRPFIQTPCYESGGTSIYCTLQDRPNGFTDTSPANAATAWYVLPINISDVTAEGVDLELNYNSQIFGRPLTLRGLVTYEPRALYTQLGVPDADYAGIAFGPTGRTATPKWRATGIVSFMPAENVRVDILESWRSSMKNFVETPTQYQIDNHVPSFATTAINLSFQIPGDRLPDSEFFFNVNNLFDADPPPANSTGSATGVGGFNGFVATDDAVGRYFTAGVRVKF